MLIGKTLEEAKAIKNIEIVEALELPPIKIHCSVLAEDSIKQAIEDYETNSNISMDVINSTELNFYKK